MGFKIMRRIISVSRRTDIPAFYGRWFINRLKQGFAGYINPFGGQKYLISLKPEEVIAFAFWSKDFTPFLDDLITIEEMSYNFYFNFTITGLPGIFECNLVDTETAVSALKQLSQRYSPKHINWRYDPILLTDVTDREWHLNRFEQLASDMSGYVERCYFSYAIQYGKVQRNYEKFQDQNGITLSNPTIDERVRLADELATIAHCYGIRMLTCCGDYLISPKIDKAHCIDGDIIKELFRDKILQLDEKPTRKECGCTESTDIGAYDTCPHGCVYCYANVNKAVALKRYQQHDPDSVFLGYTRAESDAWVTEVMEKRNKKSGVEQMGLF